MSPKCLWVSTFSTTRLLKYKLGCFGECSILVKTTFWVCLAESELKTIFYCSPHCQIFLSHYIAHILQIHILQISENKEVSSANSFTLLVKLSTISLIYIRKNNGPNIEPCEKFSNLMFDHWVKLFEIYHSESFWLIERNLY